MYTGIVERGEVVKVEPGNGSLALWVSAPLFEDAAIGASISINGVCLTVTERDGATCRFDATSETLDRSAIGSVKAGARVNVERPLRAGDELGGHLVQGHVDDVGEVSAVVTEEGVVRVRVTTPPGLMRYIVEKGSVTVDGCSLTVSGLGDDWFEVALIPHTLEVTTFGEAEPGRRVNLEVDVLARYVEKALQGRR